MTKEPTYTCHRCSRTLKLNNFAIKLWDGSYYHKVICRCHMGAKCDYLLIPDDTHVTCHNCNKELPLSAYDIYKDTCLVGKYCKKCRKSLAISYYRDHTKLYNQRAVQWRKDNPDAWKLIVKKKREKENKRKLEKAQ